MRKLFLSFFVLLPLVSSEAGMVNFINSRATSPALTNSTGLGGGIGVTAAIPDAFYYGLFIAPPSISSITVSDLLTTNWTFTGFYATNSGVSQGAAGRILGGTVDVPQWGAGVTQSFAVVGWSSNLATLDWDTVKSKLSEASLSGGVWSGPNFDPSDAGGFFGISNVGSGSAGGSVGDTFYPPLNLFQAGVNPPGTELNGVTLYPVTVPEPQFAFLVISCLMLLGRYGFPGKPES